jgi:hypothetical protein
MKKNDLFSVAKKTLLGALLLGSSFAMAGTKDTEISITNGGFETGDNTGWTLNGYNWIGKFTRGNIEGLYAADEWGNPIDDRSAVQMLTDLPNGTYKVTCLMWANQISVQRLFANSNSTLWGEEGYYDPKDLSILKDTLGEKLTFADLPNTGISDFTRVTVYTEVTDGTLSFGVKNSGNNSKYPFTFADKSATTNGYVNYDDFHVYAVSDLTKNASLSSLTIFPAGTWSQSFNPGVFDYKIVFAKGTKAVAPLAKADIAGATITGLDAVELAADGTGKSVIVVTATDGVTKLTYTLNYSVSKDIYPTFPKVANAPIIDGVINNQDSWKDANWKSQLQEKAGSSTTGCTSRFQLTHDDNNIYVVVDVKDATPSSNADSIPNTYERDCIELFFGMTQAVRSTYAPGDWQIRFQRAAVTANKVIDGQTNGGVFSDLIGSTGFSYAIVSKADGWVLEAQFPKDGLIEGSESNGKDIKFEIQTADNTTDKKGGRTQQLFWIKPTDMQWSTPADFANITLGDSPTGLSQLQSKDTYLIVKNNILDLSNVEGNVSIYNVNGSVVRTVDATNQKSINISNFAKGVYIVKGDNFVTKVIR